MIIQAPINFQNAIQEYLYSETQQYQQSTMQKLTTAAKGYHEINIQNVRFAHQMILDE